MNPTNQAPENPSSQAFAPTDDWLQVAQNMVSRLQFGSVQVTVHDGRVTQVEAIERKRFNLKQTT